MHQGFDRPPPTSGRLDVADLATTQHADAEILFFGLDAAQRGKQVAPDLDQSQRIVFGDTHALQDLELLLRAVHAAQVFCAEESVKLVPFDLERYQLRDDIIDVGWAGDVDGEGLLAVEVIATAAAGGALHFPALDVDVEHPLEDVSRLAQHNPLDGDDAGRQAAERIDQCPGIRLRGAGPGMETRSHADVRLLQHLELGLAGAPQQRPVSSGIELDGVASGPMIRIGIDISHCGYYPAPFRKHAGDIGSLFTCFNESYLRAWEWARTVGPDQLTASEESILRMYESIQTETQRTTLRVMATRAEDAKRKLSLYALDRVLWALEEMNLAERTTVSGEIVEQLHAFGVPYNRDIKIPDLT